MDTRKKLAHYLNNLFLHLPLDGARNSYEYTYKNEKVLLEKYLERSKQKQKDVGRKQEQSEKDLEKERVQLRASKKRWGESNEDFMASIATAIAESGVDAEELKAYITSRIENNVPSDYEKERKLILPVYIKLREMGYLHWDIIR